MFSSVLLVVFCLVASLGGALARKIKLPGLAVVLDLPEPFPTFAAAAQEKNTEASRSSLRRLVQAPGTVPTLWRVITYYVDSDCQDELFQEFDAIGLCYIDYINGSALSTSFIETVTRREMNETETGSASILRQHYTNATCTAEGTDVTTTIPAIYFDTCRAAGPYFFKMSTTITDPIPGITGALVTSYFGSNATCTAKTPVTSAVSIPWGVCIPNTTNVSIMYTYESSTQYTVKLYAGLTCSGNHSHSQSMAPTAADTCMDNSGSEYSESDNSQLYSTLTLLGDLQTPDPAPPTQPSGSPSSSPSGKPTQPLGSSSGSPSGNPSCIPSGQPTRLPSRQPTSQPSSLQLLEQPTRQPTEDQQTDGDALCDIYNQQTAAVKSSLTNWNCTGLPRPCGSLSWRGVTCQGDRVTALVLMDRGLEGTLPTTMGNLGSMTELLLHSNSFKGSLPTELGLLTGLQWLELHNNSFSGAVPSSFCSLRNEIDLKLQSNPGLTCLPSCLTNPLYIMLTKDSNLTDVCQENSYLVKTIYRDSSCTDTMVVATNITAIGPCIQRYAGITSQGTSYSQSITGSTLTSKSFDNPACLGNASVSASETINFGCNPLGVEDKKHGGRSFRLSVSPSVPSAEGLIQASYQSKQDCLIEQASSIQVTQIMAGRSTLWKTTELDGIADWVETTWYKFSNFNSKNFTMNASPGPDGSLSSTATFVGGTGGVSSTTLTITGVRCVDVGASPAVYCDVEGFHTQEDWDSLAAPGLVGVSGAIRENMVIQGFTSITGENVSISLGAFHFDYATHTATVPLSAALDIPAGTTLTGIYTDSGESYTMPYASYPSSSVCSYSQSYTSRDDAQKFSTQYFGSTTGPLFTAPQRNEGNFGTSVQPSSPTTVDYNGYTYATLSGVPVNGSCCETQSGSILVPPGWRLAPVSTDAIAVAAAHPWSACGLLLGSNGGSHSNYLEFYPTSSAGAPSCASAATSESRCDFDSSVDPPLVYYSRCSYAKQVMIRKCPAGTYADGGGAVYMTSWEATQCTTCPIGKSSVAGAAACFDQVDVLCGMYSQQTAAVKASLTNWNCSGSGDPCSTTSAWVGVTCSEGDVTQLSLYEKSLVGSLPSELGLLTGLEQLGLSENGLSGSLPTELGLLYGLGSLYLDGNNLVGSLPSELWLLTGLRSLGVSRNHLVGTFPTQLGLLPELQQLYLDSNSLSGSIPTQLGLLTQMQILSADTNSFVGSLPSALWLLTKLQRLVLASNNLVGSIPTELGLLIGLSDLFLDSNSLSGSIPTQLGLLTKLQRFSLDSNSLTGSIPTELGQLTGLQRLWMDTNSFSGSVPSSFCSFSTSINLQLQSNPGLTCLPSCLTTANPAYTNLNKDSTLTTTCT